MSNFLEIYIKSIPLKVPMSFGINSSVILNDIDIADRLNRKGEVSKKTFHMEFLKLNEEGLPIGREEFGFFKLDGEKLNFAQLNFDSQFNKLMNLSSVLFNGDDEALGIRMEEVSVEMYGDDNDLLEKANVVFSANSPTAKGKQKMKIKEIKKLVEDLNKDLNVFFFKVFEGRYGIGTSPKMELLSIIDRKGYKGMPQEDDFVALTAGTLKLDNKYIRWKEASEAPEEIDEVGEAIDEGEIGDISDALDDDVEAGSLSDLEDLEDI